jgi:hypothetical protein
MMKILRNNTNIDCSPFSHVYRGPAIIPFMILSTVMENIAASQAQRAREQAFEAQQDELIRQQERETEIAREAKSDSARDIDREIGVAIASSADTGATVASLSRLAGEIGGIGGLEIARIESNRMEANLARHAEATASLAEVKAAGKATGIGQFVNTISVFGKIAGRSARIEAGTPSTR